MSRPPVAATLACAACAAKAEYTDIEKATVSMVVAAVVFGADALEASLCSTHLRDFADQMETVHMVLGEKGVS